MMWQRQHTTHKQIFHLCPDCEHKKSAIFRDFWISMADDMHEEIAMIVFVMIFTENSRKKRKGFVVATNRQADPPSLLSKSI